ncbi:MAG: RNA-directed DNA polymerase [Carnobacterium maltaromaticum]
MKLNEDSIEWAIIHNKIVKDTDLFPLPKEIEIFEDNLEESVEVFKDIELTTYNWKTARRFFIPKKELSYRLATQLDPLDSILLSAIVHQYGEGIEKRRIPLEKEKVFSYRLSPNKLGHMYTLEDSWKKFWEVSLRKAEKYSYIVYVDIADFYNQIYHHTVENELIACSFPNPVKKSLINLFGGLTSKTSRGLPVGPHSTHIFAEMTLIPLDGFLDLISKEFSRYADDIIVFCDSKKEAEIMIYEIAKFIDSNQRLVLNSEKTRIYKNNEFKELCIEMTRDNPINDIELEMVETLNKYDVNLYTTEQTITLDENDIKIFSQKRVNQCLEAYLQEKSPNFDRIKWLYRRLSQIQVGSAMEFTVENLTRLTPALNEVIQYFISIGTSNNNEINLEKYGDEIFNLLDDDLVKSSNYLQLELISLFSSSNNYNHMDKLISRFESSSESIKREILLACYNSENPKNVYGWIYGLKEQVGNFDPWTKRAYYIASTTMIAENKKFFYKDIQPQNEIERYIINWAKR